MTNLLALALALVVPLAACGRNAFDTPDAPFGECSYDGECSAGKKCELATHTCNIGGCGGQLLDLTYVQPNVLLVLDRSCSMTHELGTTTIDKWTAAVTAIDDLLADHGSEARWGLTMFPDTTPAACTQDAIPLPVAAHNAGPITQTLTSALDPTDPNYPGFPCVTNIDSGIAQAATDPALSDQGRRSYLMLVTDGAQSRCNAGGGTAGLEAAITALHTSRNITTFVVGFGSEVNAAELDTLATLGGAPLPGMTKYYQADSTAQLDQAFQSITKQLISCEYTVDPAPTNLDQTYVFYDKTELVPHDLAHAAGWDYDAATMKMTFYGSFCDRLQAHAVADLDVVFGCPSPPIL